MDFQAEFSVARDAGSVALAREFTRGQLSRTGYTGSPDDVVLVASELVANALRHGRGPIVLRLRGEADRVRLEVADHDRRTPARRLSGTDGGFGLLLVSGLSKDWGVEELADGKVVWAVLSAEPAPSRMC